jgi:hypothetical protein
LPEKFAILLLKASCKNRLYKIIIVTKDTRIAQIFKYIV